MVVRNFKVHLAYARVATKRLRMCCAARVKKIHAAADLMCARPARMYADAPTSTLAYFLS